MGIAEVVIAISLFIIIMTPVMYLILGSGRVTGNQRARAVAAQIAAEIAAANPEAGKAQTDVSGITFQTQTKSNIVCEPLDSGSVPMKEITVIVTWATGHRLSVVHWYPASGACP